MRFWYLTITSTKAHESYSVTSITSHSLLLAVREAIDYFEDKFGVLASECDHVEMGPNGVNRMWSHPNGSFNAALMVDIRQ